MFQNAYLALVYLSPELQKVLIIIFNDSSDQGNGRLQQEWWMGGGVPSEKQVERGGMGVSSGELGKGITFKM